MKTLYFYLEQPYRFFVIERDKDQRVIVDQGICSDLDEVAALTTRYSELVGVVPGELVSILDVNIPIRSRKKALQALPFALEDQVAGSIDDLHFELLDWQPASASTVAVISSETWYRYVLWMDENDIELHRIVPDFELLPLQAEEAGIIFVEQGSERLLLKYRDQHLVKGVAISFDELPFWLAEFDADGKVLRCNDTRVLSELTTAGLGNEKFSDGDLNNGEIVTTLEAQHLPELCLISKPKDNSLLLYSSRQNKQALEKSKPWLMVASVCLLLALIVHLGFDVYEYRTLKVQEQALNKRITELFEQNFPQVKRIVDARRQFQREMDLLQGNTRGTQEFLYLLDNVVKSVPKNKVRVNEVFYRNSALNVTLKADNFQELDRFAGALGENEVIAFDRLSSDSQGGKVTAKYRLSTDGQ